MTKKISQVSIVTAVISLLLISGCAPKNHSIYRWGVYEQLIYEMYAEPGKANPDTQLAILSADVERTLAEGKRVPPGVHAHLGYLYYLQGNKAVAINEFSTEQALFPESTIFIDRILKRLQGSNNNDSK